MEHWDRKLENQGLNTDHGKLSLLLTKSKPHYDVEP